MTLSYYLGIDPGLSGALAFYDPLRNTLEVFDMPTAEKKVAGNKKRTIDLHALANLVDDLGDRTVSAIIEEVGAMPKQGVTSSFNFGFNTACAQMAVVAKGIKLSLVRPAVWKKEMRISRDKESSRIEASRILPKHVSNWPLKKHDGRAEAALLAYYLSQRERNLSIGDML